MRTNLIHVWSAMAAMLTLPAGARAVDITDELSMGWKMGLLPRQGGAQQDLQTFTGDLGGVKASPITKSDNPSRPFEVDGDTFPDFPTAANRACDNQDNKCSKVANNGPQKFDVSKCSEQLQQCKAAVSSAPKQSFENSVFAGSDGNFDIFCDA